jgi:hypothetical protein
MEQQTAKTTEELFEGIARNVLMIETLKSRDSDSLDFHEVSVWALRDALRLAYEAGRKSR